jgi:hypothetical protein
MILKKNLFASIVMLFGLFLANCSNDSIADLPSNDSSTEDSSSSLDTSSVSQAGASSSSQPSSSSGYEQSPSLIVSKYVAEPYIGNDKIKYSYSYEGYDFYYIYLGELRNIPIYYEDAQHFGMTSEMKYEFSTAETKMSLIEKTVSEGIQTAIGIVDAYTRSTTIGIKLSQEISTKIGAKGNFFFAEGSAEVGTKLAAEESFSVYISENKNISTQKSTSLTNTLREVSSYTYENKKNFTWPLSKEKGDRVGWYRYTLFSASDIYLYVIKDSTGVVYYEFREYVIPDIRGWMLDYSETMSFRKSDTTGFEFDVSMLDNLPKTDTSFTQHSAPIEKIETVEHTIVGNHSYTFDKNRPGTEATVDVWVLGGGGGGQGGHRWQCGLWGCDGTGGGGGGGAAAYANFKITGPVTFSTTVGNGGYAGSAGTAKSGGGHGGSGGSSSVTANGGIAFVLTAGGGGGGGTTSSGCGDPNGDNSPNYGCGAGGTASQSGMPTATLENGSHGTLGSESDNFPVGGGGGNGGNAEGYRGGTGGIGGYGNSNTGDKLRLSKEGDAGRVRIVIKYFEQDK